VTTQESRPSGSTVSELIYDVASELGKIMQGEMNLARAEVSEGARKAGGGVVKIAVAAMLGLVGLNVLTGAAIAGLAATGLGVGWASCIVGIALCFVAVALVLSAKAALKARHLIPVRAFANIRRDLSAVTSTLTSGAPHV
jgi:protein-S-isoprenylcysteine O-methyltransferase Ste14